jgi:hypothetical protein
MRRTGTAFASMFSILCVCVCGTVMISATQRYTPPASPVAAASGDVKAVLFNWMWYMGMLRGVEEVDRVATIDIRKATGTTFVNGQLCKLAEYRGSINYQVPGMRVQYTCALPNGETHKGIEVVSGQFAWDEDVVGAGLVPGRGTPTPRPNSVNERLIRIWSGPQGAPKAAAARGATTKVGMENGKVVVTFPIPGVQGATAKATLSAANQAERVEVRHGNTVTEFTYTNYGDWNAEDNKVEGFFAGRIVERRDGVTTLDLTIGETEVGNPYIVMPVPEAVRKAFGAQR